MQLYFQYLYKQEKNLRDLIMLHNYEDVLNLPKLFTILYEIDTNLKLQREDCVSEKQLKYLKFLLSKNKIYIDINFHRLSRKAASKIIDALLKTNVGNAEIINIINNSY